MTVRSYLCRRTLIDLKNFSNKEVLLQQNVRKLTTFSLQKDDYKKLSYISVPGKRPLQGMTFGDLIQSAPDRFGDRLAIIDREQGIRKTHVELQKDIYKLATGLLALNLQRGDRIAMWSPNTYEWVVTQFASAIAGLILVTINPAYQPPEFEYCLQLTDIRAVVAPKCYKTKNYYKFINDIAPETADCKPGQIKSIRYPNFDTLILITDENLPGAFRFSDIMNAGGSEAVLKLKKLQNEIDFDDTLNIQFTSGTTGRPKAVTLTHFNIINNVISIAHQLHYFDEHHRVCCNVPLFHTFGCVAVTAQLMVSGPCPVLPAPTFKPGESLKAIEEEKCTSIYGTPTMFIDLLNHPQFEKTNFSSVSRGIMAGAPCPPTLVKDVVKKMNCPGLTILYGSTELSPAITIHDMDDPLNTKLNTVGKVLDNTEVKIVDSNDKIVPLGVPGEICARGYQLMMGYWGDEEKTKEVIKKGWYHTGDVGTLNEDGYVAVVGRIKDMIIRGGENIYPREIEDYLITNPKILDAHVIGVPDERMGEEICAWIKIHSGQTMTEEDVRTFCKGNLSHFKIPRYIQFVDDYPKTTTGKIQKHKMQQQMISILRARSQDFILSARE